MNEKIQSLLGRRGPQDSDKKKDNDEDFDSEHFVSDWGEDEEDDDDTTREEADDDHEWHDDIARGFMGSRKSWAPMYMHYERARRLTAKKLNLVKKATSEDASSNHIDEVTKMLSSYKDAVSRTDIVADVIRELWKEGKHDFLRTLIPDSATLQAKDDNGCNAAHRVCLHRLWPGPAVGASDVVVLFLDKMAQQNPEIINETTGEAFQKRTCLHLAVDKSLPEVVDWLLKNGVDAGRQDANGNTASDLAFAEGAAWAMGSFALRDMVFELKSPGVRWRKIYKHNRELAYMMEKVTSPYDANTTECLVLPMNKHILVLAQLIVIRDCDKEIGSHVWEYFSFLQINCRITGVRSRGLLRREPTFAAEALSDDPMGILSVAMPYFYSGTPRSSRDRLRRYNRKTESKICPDGDKATHGLCLPLTLDEYCNLALDDDTLDVLNNDQVLVRSARRQQRQDQSRGSDAGKKRKPQIRVLMVHQAWVYRFGEHRVFAFPDIVMQEPTILNILSRKSGSVLELLLLLSAFVNLFETPIGLPKPVLDIFEESISFLSRDVDTYFKKKPKEQEEAADDEKKYFHEISDIRGELAMMREVISQQQQVWKDLSAELTSRWSNKSRMTEGHTNETAETARIVTKTSKQLQRFQDRIERADKDAERVQNLIPQYLELKRSYTAMKESHYTALLGAAVFGFSVVTIIFTPMAFVVALLAVPDNSLLVAPAKHKNAFLGKVTGITEVLTLVVTCVVIALAWRVFRDKSLLRGDEKTEEKVLAEVPNKNDEVGGNKKDDKALGKKGASALVGENKKDGPTPEKKEVSGQRDGVGVKADQAPNAVNSSAVGTGGADAGGPQSEAQMSGEDVTGAENGSSIYEASRNGAFRGLVRRGQKAQDIEMGQK